MTMTDARTQIIKAFLATTSYNDAELHPLAGDASFRRYIRIRKGNNSAMLMDAPPEKEDVHPFISVATYLHKQGFSAPQILASDQPRGLVLLEDLGDDSFTKVLKASATGERELYQYAVDVLVHWQNREKGFSAPRNLTLPLYDEALLLKEVQLFADWYLPQVMGKDKASELRSEYMQLWKNIIQEAKLSTHCFVHRDYHADNLMWLPNRQSVQKVGLLDFQDAVYGDPAYDMVSLFEDARRDVPPAILSEMLSYYVQTSGCDKDRFHTAYAILGAQRNSKIVGIFSRLAARDNKEHYLHYLPRVWNHLANDLKHPVMHDLKVWVDKHIMPDWRGVISIAYDAKALRLSA